MTGVAKNTIVKLLVELGAAVTKYQDDTLRNLPCKRLHCDEIWSFVGGKDRNLSEAQVRSGLGSVWTWTCIDADTKLVPSWLVSHRGMGAAYEFMTDVAGRLRGRVQLTTDGHKPYLEAVEGAFSTLTTRHLRRFTVLTLTPSAATARPRASGSSATWCLATLTGSTSRRPMWSVRT